MDKKMAINGDWLAYQQGLEKFYDDFAKLLREEGSMVYTERDDPQDIMNPELLLFNEHFCYDPNDDTAEELLRAMAKKGYKICMHFQEPDVIIGNVAVKIKDRWFAFGQCRNDSRAGPYVTVMWSLKYVLARIAQMEIRTVAGLTRQEYDFGLDKKTK